MSLLKTFVAGVPVAQGSKRVVQHHLIDANDARLRPWRENVTTQVRDLKRLATAPILCPVHVELVFVFPRPKAHLGAAHELKPKAPMVKTTRPDVDKLIRAVLDACTDAGLWPDDALVVSVYAKKLYTSNAYKAPGVEIMVEPA